MPAEVLEVEETTPLLHRDEQVEDDGELVTSHVVPRRHTVHQGPPRDPWHLSYWIMVIQGASMLLPWNGKSRMEGVHSIASKCLHRYARSNESSMFYGQVFITAQGFFKLKFAGSPYADNFQNYFSIAFMGTNLLVVGSAILIQKQVRISVPKPFRLSATNCQWQQLTSILTTELKWTIGTRDNIHYRELALECCGVSIDPHFNPDRLSGGFDNLFLLRHVNALLIRYLDLDCSERHVWSRIQVYRFSCPGCHGVSFSVW
jgi:hypothetical protein